MSKLAIKLSIFAVWPLFVAIMALFLLFIIVVLVFMWPVLLFAHVDVENRKLYFGRKSY